MNETIETKVIKGIAGTSFTLDEEAELIRLLGKVRQDNCRWPTEASMRATHGVCPYPAVELLIIKRNDAHYLNREILLTQFDGGAEYWAEHKFWHLPGGYISQADGADRTSDELGWGVKSLQPTVDRIAKREIKISVQIDCIANITFWPPKKTTEWQEETGAHPYGRPVSLWLDCWLGEGFQETDKIRFFKLNNLPKPIVTTHRRFIENQFGLA